MKIVSASVLLLFFIVFGPAHAMDVTGLNEPESVFKDPQTGTYYISNVNGDPLEKDNNGYITKISPDEVVVVLKFVEGREGGTELHAPKGLWIQKTTIFVADIDALKGFDLETGDMKYDITFDPAPGLLNDVTLGWGSRLYVSDMLGNRIYQVDPAKNYEVSVFKEGEELGQPNGLLFNEHTQRLLVATSQEGSILEIDQEGNVSRLRGGLAGLDGMAADHQGNLFVSSFDKGEIYKISSWGKGDLQLFETGLTTPADIFFDAERNELLVPLMKMSSTISLNAANAQKGRYKSR